MKNTLKAREMSLEAIIFNSYNELKEWTNGKDGTTFCYWGDIEDFKLGLTIDELKCDMHEDWFTTLNGSAEVSCSIKIYTYSCWYVLHENQDRTDGEVFFFDAEEDAINKAESIWNRIEDKNDYVDACFSDCLTSYESVYNPKEEYEYESTTKQREITFTCYNDFKTWCNTKFKCDFATDNMSSLGSTVQDMLNKYTMDNFKTVTIYYGNLFHTEDNKYFLDEYEAADYSDDNNVDVYFSNNISDSTLL